MDGATARLSRKLNDRFDDFGEYDDGVVKVTGNARVLETVPLIGSTHSEKFI